MIARYEHDTSREFDPQLHTHLVAGNLTYDGVEGKWKALQASAIYEQREYLTEVYRNALAREVLKLGYQSKTALNTAKITASALSASRKPRSKNTASGVRNGMQAIAEFLNETVVCHLTTKSRAWCGIPGPKS